MPTWNQNILAKVFSVGTLATINIVAKPNFRANESVMKCLDHTNESIGIDLILRMLVQTECGVLVVHIELVWKK